MEKNSIKLSLVIPARDKNDQKLAELLASIDRQDFPKEQMEVLVITEGTSESAKAIGIRRAKGEVIGILASDNTLEYKGALSWLFEKARVFGAVYPIWYEYNPTDDYLNRYFSLIGGNDPLSYYMDKNDRITHFQPPTTKRDGKRSYGDNGFFVRRDLIIDTNLDNYYHIDNANEIGVQPVALNSSAVRHNTGGNFLSFFAKRYRYGLQHAFNQNRRWHLVDFSQPKDIMRLLWFILASLTLIHPLMTSLKGYRKLPDLAWFVHPIACLMTVLTYGVLMIHVGCLRLARLLYAPTVVQKA